MYITYLKWTQKVNEELGLSPLEPSKHAIFIPTLLDFICYIFKK